MWLFVWVLETELESSGVHSYRLSPRLYLSPSQAQVLDSDVCKFIAVPLLSTNFKVPSRIVIIIVIVDLVPGPLEKEQ